MADHRGFDPPDGGPLEHSVRGAEEVIELKKRDTGLPCARCDELQAEIERLREEVEVIRRDAREADQEIYDRLERAIEPGSDFALSLANSLEWMANEMHPADTVEVDLAIARLRGEE